MSRMAAHASSDGVRSTINQLVALGFDRELATRQVSQQLGAEKAAASPDPALGAIAFPLAFTLPWSALVSDDERTAPAMRTGQVRPVQILTERYRTAKEKAKVVIRSTVIGCAPVAMPLALVARVWVPDNRTHDVPNFAKCVHDALQKLVVVNDSWLHDVRWIRAGVDVDHPRAEITITPLAP